MVEIIIAALVALILGGAAGFFIFRYVIKGKYNEMIEAANKEAEVVKEKKLLEVKEKFLNKKAELEKEVQQRNSRIQQSENKLKQREISLNQRQEELGRRKQEVEQNQQRIDNEKKLLTVKQQELEKMQKMEQAKLEELSGLSAEEAKQRLVESLKDQAKLDAASYINEIMDDAKLNANQQAKKIVIQTIQRVATETAIENSVSVFHIDNDEVKGRIIGREGRNIKAIENATGVDLIIDDTPEVITLSCFDPIRREVARLSLETLIHDGRIQPGRIEEVVAKTKKDLDDTILKAGQDAVFELGLSKMNKELVMMIGKLKYRTSYGQNALQHSIEVAHFAGIMASELGLNQQLAKRAGLLHDLGKAVDHEMEGSHVELGAKFAKKFGENATVINAIESHHGDVPATSIIAVLISAADTLSAARPGSRSEKIENYIQRLEKLEELPKQFEGVDKVFAIQAGREIRVIVNPEKIDDLKAHKLARDVKEKIETELTYPGHIKVTVIREIRANEIAK